jgi:hypothetical protein
MPMLYNESHCITKDVHHLDLSHHWSWIKSRCDPNFYSNWWIPLEMLGFLLSMSDEWLSLISTQYVPGKQSSIWRCNLLMPINETWMKILGLCLVGFLCLTWCGCKMTTTSFHWPCKRTCTNNYKVFIFKP